MTDDDLRELERTLEDHYPYHHEENIACECGESFDPGTQSAVGPRDKWRDHFVARLR